MGKARSITLETRLFEKAGDATLFFREMLHRYALEEKVSEEDSKDLAALLKRHDECDEKIGSGISYFKVSNAPHPHSGRCFWIVRTDDSEVDFSVPYCLAPKA